MITRCLFAFSKKSMIFKHLEVGKKQPMNTSLKEIKKLFENTNQDMKDNIVDTNEPSQLIKQVDTSFDKFFLRRKYDTTSFNFLIESLTAQGKNQIEEVLNMMERTGVKLNVQTYLMLIQSCGRFKNIQRGEKYFQVALEKFGDSIYLRNSLIDMYAKTYNADKAMKVFLEMKEKGMKPNVFIYTSLINAFYRIKDYQRCQDLFFDARSGDISDQPDANLCGLMIEICASTNDAEKAMFYYSMMSDMEHSNTTKVFNALIKALGSRTDYAERGIEKFRLMLMRSVPIDSDTVVHTLKACATIGYVKTAFDVIRLMKENKIPENRYIYNQIIRVYAGACNLPMLDQKIVENYDAWVVLNEAISKQMVTTHTLNSMCELMVNSQKLADLEGLVFPLYDQLQIQKDTFTFQSFIKILHQERKILDVFKIYEQHITIYTPTFQSVCCYLEAAMLAADEDRVIKALETFKEINRVPKFTHLSRLGSLQNIPIRLHALLDEFDTKFGAVRQKIYKSYQKPKE